jgi:hypothetical protein
MASTVGGTLKTYLEAQGLGVSVFVRDVPPGQGLPYVVIHEGISAATDGTEDGGNARGGMTPVSEEIQIDLFMYARDPDAGSRAESYTLPYALARALAGPDLGTFASPARRIYGCHLTDGPRQLDDPSDDNLIRKIYAVVLRRDT